MEKFKVRCIIIVSHKWPVQSSCL